MSKYIGIDYGTKNVGIALSNEDATMAFPHIVLANSRDLMGRIAEIVEQENISCIVVGESKDYKGEDNLVMQKIRAFVEALNAQFNIPVALEPEFMTSSQASHIQGVNNMIDASAATIILQSFLDKKES
jgi:putative Holliday junction resolvase